MLRTAFNLIGKLSHHGRRMFWTLIGLYMVVGILQAISVASIGPFVAVVLEPESFSEGAGPIPILYDSIGFSSTFAFIAFLGGAAASLIIIAQISFLLVERIRINWMHNTVAEIQCDVLSNILHRPYSFFATRHSGSLNNVVLGETNTAALRFIFPMIELFSRLTIIFFLIILMLFVDAQVALLAGALLALVVLAVQKLTTARLRLAGQAMRQLNEQRFTRATEIFGAHKEIKLRGTEDEATSSFADIAVRYADVSARSTYLMVLPRPLIEMFLFAGVILAIASLAIGSPSAMLAFVPKASVFLLAGYRILPNAQLALQTLQGMRTGEPVVKNVLNELDHPIDTQNRTNTAYHQNRSELREFASFGLSDVSFEYPGSSQPALSQIDLTIESNTCVGIVGGSGAGKSTLMDVMLGLLEPSSGSLRVDGRVMDKDEIRGWRGDLGYVSQTIFIADDTIAANIAFGDPEPDVSRVRQAVRLAALGGFVASQSEGLDFQVGEGGARLSGGQRQRLAIARALYNDPKILFLDEATSALDAHTEAAIMRELQALVGSRTIIIVAHRLATLSICDRIIEVKDGRIARDVRGSDFFAETR